MTAKLGTRIVCNMAWRPSLHNSSVRCCNSAQVLQGQSGRAGGPARVVLSAELGGLEDVPPGVVAVLTSSPVDLLSHIAIRARNTGVLLASCSDSQTWDGLVSKYKGKTVQVSAGPGSGDVTIEAASARAASTASSNGSGGNGADAPRLQRPEYVDEWALPRDSFRDRVVGAKSLGLQRLAKLASGSDFTVPPAFALPYGTFERALDAAPREKSKAFDAAVRALEDAAPARARDLDMPKVRQALAEVQNAVKALPLPRALRSAVADAVAGQDQVLAGWKAISDDGSEARSAVLLPQYVLKRLA